MKREIENPKGKLGILSVGLNGAVTTTFLAGTLAIRKGDKKPIGSLTQMGTIRIGRRIDNNFPLIKDFVPLANLNDLVFGGWDIRNENVYESAISANVLEKNDLETVKDEMKRIKPMKAVFEKRFVKRLDGDWVKTGSTKYELMESLREDIRNFKKENKLDRVVVIWSASTEIFIKESEVHSSLKLFEEGMKNNHPDISPSMLYAYAALAEGAPFVMGAPNLSVEIPALVELSLKNQVPIAGKDYKTGQTLVKTVIAPMLKARMLGLHGWFSTNILGNRDGEVLDEPDNFKTKEESKLSVIDTILQPELYPDLYNKYYHKVRINYYPPRGDNKEGWDNIDIFGWMGYPMQLKINFLCRDSILAAPIVLDLALFADLALRSGMYGIQEWLSFYFKSPIHSKEKVPEHDLFIQLMKLKNTLRKLMGVNPITHLDSNGVEESVEEYYPD
ncbi:Inositol-3-phosphate synthase [Melioribacter roseus P3M-2]|uniref:Inositol-3-phosphate synthase n=1 Tax=Melioribacter roseus (strain DSM 23840 / JCM 17771 / VKM B-2668 / P3M-2) TaxID=1191523 RepID=I7A3P4_MELRP|nr:inositol-3-phosphate synthase [Melioribacter roseus]AFN74506.1 Inositol-3-phosphate synthase [Melioribacter roseus P3M-2]